MNDITPISKPSLPGFNINEEIVDVNSSANQYLWKHYEKEVKWGIVAGIVFYLIALVYIFKEWQAGQIHAERAFIILAVPIGVYFVILNLIIQKLRHLFYQQFAKLNGFTYQKTGWLNGLSGALFKVGYDQRMEDIIEGQIANLPITLFNFRYTLGSGKSAQNYAQTVWKIDIKTLLPPTLLLVDKHSFGDNISNNNLNNVSKIDLSGNLEKHFSLYTERKFEVEALQIFSPEFLQRIYENYKQFSLDFSETCIFVYANKIIHNKTELESLKSFIFVLTQRLLEKLPSISGFISALNTALEKAPISPFSVGNISLGVFDGRVSKFVWIIPLALLLIFLIFILFADKYG